MRPPGRIIRPSCRFPVTTRLLSQGLFRRIGHPSCRLLPSDPGPPPLLLLSGSPPGHPTEEPWCYLRPGGPDKHRLRSASPTPSYVDRPVVDQERTASSRRLRCVDPERQSGQSQSNEGDRRRTKSAARRRRIGVRVGVRGGGGGGGGRITPRTSGSAVARHGSTVRGSLSRRCRGVTGAGSIFGGHATRTERCPVPV